MKKIFEHQLVYVFNSTSNLLKPQETFHASLGFLLPLHHGPPPHPEGALRMFLTLRRHQVKCLRKHLRPHGLSNGNNV